MSTPKRRILVAAAALCGLLPGTAGAWDELLVLTTDYATYGGATVVERRADWEAEIDAATVTSDAVARWHDGLYYVVNRGAASIQVLDPAQGLAELRQFSVGVGRTPHDIAFAPDGTAYVSCYDEAVFLRVDTVAGAVTGNWSTAAFADADGLPETSWMQAVGNLIYVTCQRLDRNDWWNPAGGSRLLVFDTVAGDWLDPVMLTGQNPYAQPHMTPDGRGLHVATTGFWLTPDAGLERVDLVTGQSGAYVATEQELGGEILSFVVAGPAHGWCVVSDAAFVTHLKTFVPGGGAVTTIASAGGYDYVDVSWDGEDLVYLCDRSVGASGLRVFDAWTGVELTPAPVAVGRPPFMCVPPEECGATAVGTSPPPPAVLRAPWPNPANPRTRLAFAAAPGARVRLDVCDLRGRVLRTARATAGADGEGVYLFDGLDARGRPLASGTYRAVIDGAASRAFTLVR